MYINIGSGYDLSCNGTKALPEPILTGRFWHPDFQDILSSNITQNYIFKDLHVSARGHWVIIKVASTSVCTVLDR